MKERGRFVVLEGGVGAGKSTQEQRLREKLEGWAFYREPGGTDFGEKLRPIIQGPYVVNVHPYAALFGYAASRANLIRGVVIPKIEEGTNVLLDRYWYSSFAYQGAEGISKLAIWGINLIATDGLRPDLVLHYEIPPEMGTKRKREQGGGDRYDYKDLEFHIKVRNNYRILKRLYPQIWRTIDASLPVQIVFEDSLEALHKEGIV